MTPAARLQAVIDILGQIEGTAKPVERLLRDWGRAHRFAGSKDRAAIADDLYAILRHRSSLAWRMGSDTPRALAIAFAAERAETLFRGEGYGPAALGEDERAALAHPPPDAPPLHVQSEYPPFLEDELKRAFGDDLLPEMLALQQRAPVDLRVNRLKAQRDDVLRELRAQGYDAEPTSRSPLGIRLPAGTKNLERTPSFLSGAFEFQDEAAQLAALLCEAKPGMRVLDLAAGAGGKSLALAAQMQNRGEIVATDVRAQSLVELAGRAKRAGVTIIQTQILPLPHAGGGEGWGEGVSKIERAVITPSPLPSPPEGGEGTSFQNVSSLREGEGDSFFDVVLLDAPCSGTGTWRRQPELRWRLTPQRLRELMATQDELLARAAAQVKSGGRLVYATCSVLPCENEDRIAAFLQSHPDFRRAGEDFRASPHSTSTDGFYAAVLGRSGV